MLKHETPWYCIYQTDYSRELYVLKIVQLYVGRIKSDGITGVAHASFKSWRVDTIWEA
jgi:hypothetical protein